jgi:hypothetical protein
MIYLVQLLRRLNNEQLELFSKLFADLDFEINELGYKGMESDLINDMLHNHFGIWCDVESQIRSITNVILNKKYLAAVSIEKTRRV